jgi:hypothetical protein
MYFTPDNTKDPVLTLERPRDMETAHFLLSKKLAIH